MQAITTGDFDTFFAATGNGSSVFDSNCVSLQRTARQSGDTTTIRFNAPAAGTYFIATNFDARNTVGEPGPNPTTVHYEFTTTGVPNSTYWVSTVSGSPRSARTSRQSAIASLIIASASSRVFPCEQFR